MKTLLVLLLLAAGIGAAYWKTQRPDDGIDALRADAAAAVDRLRTGFEAVKEGSSPANAVAAVGQNDQATSGDSQTAQVAEQVAEQAQSLDTAQSGIAAIEDNLDNTRDALNLRIDALENQLSQAGNADTPAGLQARLEDVESQLSSTGAMLADFNPSSPEIDDALQRLSALEGSTELLGRRMDENDVSTRLDELEQRLEGMSTAIDALNTRTSGTLDNSAESFATLNDQLETLDARVGTLAAGGAASADGSTITLQGLDAATDQRIAALESKLQTASASALRLDALGNRFARMEERLDEANSTDETLRAAISDVETSVGELSTSTDALSIDSVQQQIREQLASLDAEVDTEGEADVAELTDSLETTRERIQALETRVQDLPASSSAAGDAQETQSALEAQIAALERRLEDLPSTGGTDPALVNSLTEVREKVAKLSTQDFVTQEELRAQVEGRNVEYKIYFDKNSTQITSEAARVLDSFIAQETNRTTGVSIFGFTDRAGAATYNQQLAQRRATAVRSYLIQNGFDFTKIGNVAGLGEDAAAALLEDEQEDAQQRVVVLYAAQL